MIELEKDLSRIDPHDQRRYLRYEVLHFATVFPNDGGDPLHCVIVDIGLGGLQYRTRIPLAIGSTILLSIGRSDLEPPLTVRAEVRHCESVENSDLYAVGVRFAPGDQQERMAIASHVHEVFRRQCELMAI